MTANKNGYTLVELLVGLAMASVVMTAIFISYQAQVKGKISQDSALDMQQAGRAGLELVSADIRMAGCDPTAIAGAGIITADAEEFRFTMDITGGGDTLNESDGKLESAGEDVRYALSGGGDFVRERFLNGVSDGGEQPLIENVDAVNFVYLDQNGVVTATPEDIRQVELAIVVRSGDQIRAFQRGYTDSTTYRNLRGDVILDPQDDKFSRILLTTSVYCRNMGR